MFGGVFLKLKYIKKITSIFVAGITTLSFMGLSKPVMVQASETTKNGTFNVLSLNVAGLPEGLSSSNPKENTLQMSNKLNNYDLVSVQEDFAYHKDLIKYDNHPYKTEHSGNVPLGDGMNFMSNFPLCNTTRCKWNKTHGFITDGADQMTPKGILYSSMEIQPGYFIDIYDLHADADCDDESYAARQDNMRQLASLIEERSTGKAVIVIGDTNSRYTRAQDNFEEAVVNKCGLTDAWIQLVRNGDVPADGDALMNADNPNSADNEVVDKIWYRSGENIDLEATDYNLLATEFTDADGNQLSDHHPITASFKYTLDDDLQMSDTYGGGGGTGFSFINEMNDSFPTKIAIKAGTRLDSVSFTYNTNTAAAGGNGGDSSQLALADGEYITSMELSKSKKNTLGTYRISYVKFTTNLGHVLEGGTKGETTTFTAPDGYGIAGLYGCADNEIDRLGAIYKAVK